MIPTLIGMLNLFLRLWWLWLILMGPVLVFSRPVSLKLLVLAAVLVVASTLYLVLTPLEGLQIALPAAASSPPPQLGPSGGMPVADTFEWNLLPGFYDVVNYFFIPLLKQFWYIWVPGWLLILAVEAINPKRRRARR